MFLSAKINAMETGFHTYWTVIIAVLLALVGGSIAFINSSITVLIHGTTIHIPVGLILLPFALMVYLFLLKYRKITKKEVEPLEEVLGDIIDGENDSNKIRERWNKISLKKR